ncbi:MAG: SipW-dependent-type signal peptide-containing protein [Culicoidibacterales bacterium]
MTSKQKKVAAGALVAFLAVGGTAAFFTSSDDITNIFSTGTTTDPKDENAGIDVNEDFKGPKWTVDGDGNLVATDTEFDDNTSSDGYGEVAGGPTQVLPGDKFTKQVRVSSEAEYNQFVRARVEVTYENLPDGKTAADAAQYLKITYNTEAAGTTALSNGVWLGAPTETTGVSNPVIAVVPAEQTWFYYSKILGATPASTADLIKSVQLTENAPNWMKNVKFNVIVKAESIQATPTAWTNSVVDGGWAQTSTAPTAVDGN